MLEYYGKYDKKQTVELFVDNLIWGNISINSFGFQMDDGTNFRKNLEQNIISFKKNPTSETIDLIYEAIIRLRVHGALSRELRDLSTQDAINRLTEVVNRKDGQISSLQSDNETLAIKLHEMQTTEPPKKKGFNAVS